MPTPLDILFRDEHLVAVRKPSGMAVHRSDQVQDHRPALQTLRNQLRQWVYPVHRLDRGTSGVLLFALDPDTAAAVGRQLTERQVDKRYLAVVRGYAPEDLEIDYALREDKQQTAKPAQSTLRRLGTVELPIPVGRYPQARYSLVELQPHTGRSRQLRKHMAHIRHPIAGDVSHGEGRHNRLFREHFGVHRLLLHAHRLELTHPHGGEPLHIEAPVGDELRRLFDALGWNNLPAAR
ncbi:MAG: pseudouridine synthase [Myxococcota bacterium]